MIFYCVLCDVKFIKMSFPERRYSDRRQHSYSNLQIEKGTYCFPALAMGGLIAGTNFYNRDKSPSYAANCNRFRAKLALGIYFKTSIYMMLWPLAVMRLASEALVSGPSFMNHFIPFSKYFSKKFPR